MKLVHEREADWEPPFENAGVETPVDSDKQSSYTYKIKPISVGFWRHILFMQFL